MTRRLLVLGSTGLLGQEVVRQARQRGWDVTGAARSGGDMDLDVRDAGSLAGTLEAVAPDVVVNCAAIVDLALCEREPGLAYEVNARPAALLADWIGDERMLVHISTDHLFGGSGDQAHSEDAAVKLLNEYARTKYAGEQFALTAGHALAIRTSIVGIRGWEKDSFAEWAIHAIDRGDDVTAFADAFTSSIDTPSFASALFELIEKQARGLLNIGSRQVYSKANFLAEIARQRGRELSATHGKVPQSPIRRATALGLDVSKASRLLSQPLPSLEEVVASILHQHDQRARDEL